VPHDRVNAAAPPSRARGLSSRRLSTLAAGLAVVLILIAALAAYFAYDVTRRFVLQNAVDYGFQTARTLAAHAERSTDSAAATVEDLADLWREMHHTGPGGYLCVVQADGRLALHTARPERRGDYAGSIPVAGGPGGASDALQLVTAGGDWVGPSRSLDGQPQVIAFAYVPRLHALVAVHLPIRDLEARVRTAVLPWAIAFGLVALVLLPGSLALMHRAYRQSGDQLTRSVDALRLSEARYRNLVDQASDGIFITDPNGCYIDVNDAGCRMVGYTREELLGQHLRALLTPRELEERPLRLDDLRAGRTVLSKRRLRRQDGVLIPVEISARALPDGRFQGIARDISERRDLETQLRESQKMEALGQLAGGVAHDFNNLLTVMIGHAEELVKRFDPRDPRVAAVEEIRQAAEHAAALTRRLLAFSRRQVLQPIELDLNDVIDRMDRLLRRVIGEDVTLTTVLDPGTGVIMADPGQIEQVVLNLVVNARDAMPDGGQLTIATGVRMSGPAQPAGAPGASDSYAVLRIRDTGVGMDRHTKARIFEPFFTTKERGQGIGLGLSTVYGIAQQCGWDIVVDSEPGRGSTFTLYFPRIADRPESAMAPSLDSFEGRGETILLVEDDESVRRLARTVLQRHGYQERATV